MQSTPADAGERQIKAAQGKQGRLDTFLCYATLAQVEGLAHPSASVMRRVQQTWQDNTGGAH